MRIKTHHHIPQSTQHGIVAAPKETAVAVLLRHSVRDSLSPLDVGYALPITTVGAQLAQDLGVILGNQLRSLHTSPLTRCVQTAQAIQAGARRALRIQHDRLLGDPGIFVVDGKRAFSNWHAMGHEKVMAHLVSQDTPLPGMANPDSAARFLVQHMLASSLNLPGFHLFVTHDLLVTATAARMLGTVYGIDDWPDFLEAAFFWRDGDTIVSAYRDTQRQYHPFPLCHLNEGDVIEFARREIAQAVGCDCPAHFFLVGDAFNTLLTGVPPSVLTVWASSKQDRALLRITLAQRGALQLNSTPISERFNLGNRIVEVPFDTGSVPLASMLERFDVGLCVVGVEFVWQNTCRAIIHSLAKECVGVL